MTTSYQHLLIIIDGEVQENSLHATDHDRAERLIEWSQEVHTFEEVEELNAILETVGRHSAPGKDQEGVSAFSGLNQEDRLEALRQYLANEDIDLHLDELSLPEAAEAVDPS